MATTAPDGCSNSPWPTCQTAGFTVDPENHLTSVSPPGRPAHQFGYNAVGLLTSYTPPTVGGLDASVHYTYDADRHLISVSLPDGQDTVLTRGPRRGRQQALGSGPTLTYQYGSYNLLTNIVSSTGDGLSFFGYQGMFRVTNLQWSGPDHGAVRRPSTEQRPRAR